MDGSTLSSHFNARSRFVLTVIMSITVLVHPATAFICSTLIGAGLAVAALVRYRRQQTELNLDIGTYIEEQTFSSDTAVEIVEWLRGTSAAEVRSAVHDRAFFAGMTAEREQAMRRRSEAAHKAAMRKKVGK